MCLIFDSFQTRQDAEEFAHDFNGRVFDSQDESDEIEPFPFQLFPPIVLVERIGTANNEVDINAEEKIEKAVEKYGGEFAGT